MRPAHHRRRLTHRRRTARGTCLVLAAALAIGACRRVPPPSAVDVVWSLDPTPVRVGVTTVVLTLQDAGGAPVRGATVRLEGHMAHPGMTPALATASEMEPGVYRARLDLTMAGDWVVLVEGSMTDGRRIEKRIDLPGVRPAS